MAEDNNGGTGNKGISTEREFLHDLATPVSVALGNLETTLDDDSKLGPLSENQRTRLEKALKAVDRIRQLMEKRRAEIRAAAAAAAQSN